MLQFVSSGMAMSFRLWWFFMLPAHLIEMLRCPVDGSVLHEADADLLERLNQAIAAGQLRNRGEKQIDGPLSGALVNDARTTAYPVYDDIPQMLTQDAISLETIAAE